MPGTFVVFLLGKNSILGSFKNMFSKISLNLNMFKKRQRRKFPGFPVVQCTL